MALINVGTLVFEFCNEPESPYLLTCYPLLRQMFTVSLLIIIHILGVLYECIICSMGEIVPAFEFYHTSLSIQALDEASKKIFSAITNRMNVVSIMEEHKTGTEERFMQIWSLYENVRHIVSEANHLLGPYLFTFRSRQYIQCEFKTQSFILKRKMIAHHATVRL